MNKVILDASALLALFKQEHGHEIVEKHLANVVMSSVNVSEVIAYMIETGIEYKDAEQMTTEVIKEVIAFDLEQACIAAALKKKTKSFGLSLGDRACLALAKIKDLPVLTADRIWHKLEEDIKIQLIR